MLKSLRFHRPGRLAACGHPRRCLAAQSWSGPPLVWASSPACLVPSPAAGHIPTRSQTGDLSWDIQETAFQSESI